MNPMTKTFWLRLLSYVLVAAVSSAVTFFLFAGLPTKLEQLEGLIEDKYIGEYDRTAAQDAAAQALIDAIGDRWSYYIPASQYAQVEQSKENVYVGVGFTVQRREDKTGFDVLKVESNGPAGQAGVLPGDVIIAVDGESAAPMDINEVSDKIRGQAGTKVSIQLLRDGEPYTVELERKKIQVAVATGQLLEGGIGLVTITNFNERCYSQTKSAVEKLLDQGATALIFDVRNNPGGYLTELIDVLDYLLPEGDLFRSLDYTGAEKVYKSSSSCIQVPMAVLINADSYSAAEFFAAALEEYDWAITVGEATCGKGYFQNTYQLIDGSAVALSVGKYFTPNGVSLADVGGLVPNVQIPVDDETWALIYSGLLDPAEDPQIQAAIGALKN